ncbi:MAG: aquaporin [Ilumatobacter sp.]|uniref:aquaporin n=1 Tax=Ilumatobacter sp. TaxID=1967498 RepID=UPI002622422B|nr:aquaporin [Ilumatobacter sp.]MDJ0768688.1 aquaporin [Ilumatobacter sp.]
MESTGRLIGAEFVGTTIVMLGGPGLLILGSSSIGPLGVAIGFGLAIALSIGVIGAVANPMFSLALWFSRGIDGREFASDLVGQVLGGIFGAAVIFGLNDTDRFTRGVNGWDRSGFGELGVVLAAELIMGTVAVVVLLSSISQQRSNGTMAAFTGAAYALGTLFLLDLSGAGMNPARSLGAAVFADTDPNALGQLWAFVVVPIVAAFAGTLVWLAIDDATIDETIFDDSVLEDVADAIAGDDD